MLTSNEPLPAYGAGRELPVHATLDEPVADLDSGLLPRIHAAMLGIRTGQVLRIASPLDTLADQLRSLERSTGHALLTVIEDRSRPGYRLHFVRKGRARTEWSASPSPAVGPPGASMAGLMPTRLWLYTNFDCNLACDYCCVVAGPRADPRRLHPDRVRALVDQAARRRFERVFLTGGEPMLRPDLAGLLDYASARLPVTLLTNAMLVRGRRWGELRPLIDQRRPITFQVSLDSADREAHDRHRGAGSHARALEGIRTLLAAGAHVRIAATLPEDRLGDIPALHALADRLGIGPRDRIFRPIALRGAARDGEPIRPEDIAPDLTADALGWSWHPLSNDPDMRLDAPADASLEVALEAVRRRLEAMVAEQSVRLDRFVCG